MATHITGEAESHSATPLASHPADDAEREPPRSGYGLIPGAELPGAVYVTALRAYVWMLAAAWLAFGSSEESDLNLGVATVLAIVIFALPVLIVRVAAGHRTKEEAPMSSARQLAICRCRRPACRFCCCLSCWPSPPRRSA